MSIGERIKSLRKVEKLTQQGLAELLGVKQSYVARLESGKNIPSEQLILNICRTFKVRIEWLKHGEGEMYDTEQRFTAKGKTLIDAIYKKLISPNRVVSLDTVATVLGIEAMPKQFPDVLTLLIQVCKEGDKDKINAIMAQLRALRPHPLEKKDIINREDRK